MSPEFVELEERAFRAWPAEEVGDILGFRCRATRGVTRRANSAFPARAPAPGASTPLAERVGAVEAFYAVRGAPAMFHVSAVSAPPGLDDELAARGYVVDARTAVQTVETSRFGIVGQPPQIATRVTEAASDEWFRLATTRGRFAGVEAPYRGILDRIGSRAGFALATWKGTPISIGLGVLDSGWLGIFGMATVPEARRRRAATAVLGALVGWGAARGAEQAYLQVEEDNAPSLALYRASGFETRYAYHYRVPAPR